MKTITYIKKYTCFPLLLVLMTFMGCERSLSDEVVYATFPNTAEVFTDAPIGLTDEFFVSFDPAEGANPNGFDTDDNETYRGTSSIRIDVPSPNDPDGGFIGGIFIDRGEGRNLTEYDALTFWARSSTTVTDCEFGFGTDFVENKYSVSRPNTSLSTNWKKYIIPIPDPSKLIKEKGMFLFSAGTQSTGGQGYTFWIDEIRFENLGTLAQAQPTIFNGADLVVDSYNGATSEISGFTQTLNAGDGQNITVNTTSGYFQFSSSDTGVAIVNESGEVTVLSEGSAVITAFLDGVKAEGSLTVNSLGNFLSAPIPSEDPSNVISIFSDAYTNITIDSYNPRFEGQNTMGGLVVFGTDAVLRYSSLDFVSIQFLSTVVDASSKNTIHFDIFIQEPIDASDVLRVELVNDANNDGALVFQGGIDNGGSKTVTSSSLSNGSWIGIDIPLDEFNFPTGGNGFSGGIGNRTNLGSLTFASGGISTIIVDNIYLY